LQRDPRAKAIEYTNAMNRLTTKRKRELAYRT